MYTGYATYSTDMGTLCRRWRDVPYTYCDNADAFCNWRCRPIYFASRTRRSGRFIEICKRKRFTTSTVPRFPRAFRHSVGYIPAGFVLTIPRSPTSRVRGRGRWHKCIIRCIAYMSGLSEGHFLSHLIISKTPPSICNFESILSSVYTCSVSFRAHIL